MVLQNTLLLIQYLLTQKILITLLVGFVCAVLFEYGVKDTTRTAVKIMSIIILIIFAIKTIDMWVTLW